MSSNVKAKKRRRYNAQSDGTMRELNCLFELVSQTLSSINRN